MHRERHVRHQSKLWSLQAAVRVDSALAADGKTRHVSSFSRVCVYVYVCMVVSDAGPTCVRHSCRASQLSWRWLALLSESLAVLATPGQWIRYRSRYSTCNRAKLV